MGGCGGAGKIYGYGVVAVNMTLKIALNNWKGKFVFMGLLFFWE